jgi:hypothetical protein
MAIVVAGIVTVEIEVDGPSSAVVVVDVANPQVGYTPYSTSEEHR